MILFNQFLIIIFNEKRKNHIWLILIYLILWFVYYQLFKSILITINFSIYIPLFEFFLLLVFLHYYKYKKFTKFNIYVVKL